MAYSISSRIWYTVSHGILNEIYYPTIDTPQTRDMQFLLTDGETFFHEEKRDLDRIFEYIDSDALALRLTNRDRGGRYSIVKEVIADPHHPAILMRVRFEGDDELLSRMKAYALLAPHLEVGGKGNSGAVIDVAGKRTLLAWKNETSLALATTCGFSRASCGYVGRSDGWQDLANDFQMDWEFGTALDGNIALTGEIDLRLNREFIVAIALGRGHHAALTGALEALNTPFDQSLQRFIEQWHRVATPKSLAAASCDGGRLLQISHNTLLAHEDKQFSGAFIASASIPWGQSKGDDDLGGYHLVWTRDMVQSATALMACRRTETARRALVYLACTQRTDGSFPQNFWVNGAPYWSGIQLDEVALPIVLAWRLWKLDALGGFDILAFVERAASFLLHHSPITQQERWEENAGYSPSTLAAVIAGLICAAEIVRARGSHEFGQFLEEHADWIESHLEDWTVTNDGILLPEVKRHYMRIRPPECGAPYAHEGCGRETIHISNRPPGARTEFEAREIIDAGFLELVRYGVRRADDPLIVDSLKVVDHVLKVDTPNGPCWRRYNFDGYGQRANGRPFRLWGQGRAWPLLAGERAHYELAAGRDVSEFISSFERFSSQGGMLPEQIWDEADLPEAGLTLGRPAASAMPLMWAHAEYVKLLRSVVDGRIFDRVAAVEERYGAGRKSSHLEIFTFRRQVGAMTSGKSLRLLAEERFVLRWSMDDWQTVHNTASRPVWAGSHHVDLPTAPGQAGRISFTFEWPIEQRWEGRNFTVELENEPADAPGAG